MSAPGTGAGDRYDPEMEQRLRRLALRVVTDLPCELDHAARILNYAHELLDGFIFRPSDNQSAEVREIRPRLALVPND